MDLPLPFDEVVGIPDPFDEYLVVRRDALEIEAAFVGVVGDVLLPLVDFEQAVDGVLRGVEGVDVAVPERRSQVAVEDVHVGQR